MPAAKTREERKRELQRMTVKALMVLCKGSSKGSAGTITAVTVGAMIEKILRHEYPSTLLQQK